MTILYVPKLNLIIQGLLSGGDHVITWQAPTVSLVLKDRVLAHNTIAAHWSGNETREIPSNRSEVEDCRYTFPF
jgi:uncharacterized metal-binding protein